jgi:UDP-GlcNAc:undecaprenyl-phosphate GlcNAc-1-phosphate transferase
VLLATVSFVDDILQKTFVAKIMTQILCVCVALASGVVLTRLAIPHFGEVALGWLGYVLTFLWILGLTNAYNFMDGLDGLAAGVAVIAAAFLGAIALEQNSVFVYLSSYLLLAGSAGFLLFNFPPARIFMGEVGSAFLGFTFAILAVIGASLDLGHLSFYIVPMLLFHFIFDTVFTFIRRIVLRHWPNAIARTRRKSRCFGRPFRISPRRPKAQRP